MTNESLAHFLVLDIVVFYAVHVNQELTSRECVILQGYSSALQVNGACMRAAHYLVSLPAYNG